MKALKKLHKARKLIKESPIKKEGWNDYSKYKYFTPEQISGLVNDANNQMNLFHKFDLVRTDQGLMARLEVFDLDSEDSVQFQIATEIPSIKATNVAQQLGGCVTYSERYLLMIAYDIKDNNLDFDTDKKKAPKKKPILNLESEKWPEAIKFLRGNGTIEQVKESYEISEEDLQTLILASEL